MTYITENFSKHNRNSAEFRSLKDARAEAARRLGVAELSPDMQGGCPDDDDDGLIGVECWLDRRTDNPYADAESAIYILRRP